MKIDTIPETLVWAHRGRNRRAPENTMASFCAALDGGDKAIELDVALSSDREIIVVHDDTVDRTTNGTGSVSDLSLRDLEHLDAGSWFHPDFSSERLPSLSMVLDEAKGRAIVNIEIKRSAWRMNPEDGIEQLILDLVMRKKMIDSVLISGFDWRSLHRVRNSNRTIALGVLADTGWRPEKVAAFATDISAFSIHPDKNDVIDRMPEPYKKFKGRIYPYTVTDELTGQKLIQAGADGYFADMPFS